jgi:hypothetical protein
LRNGESAPTRAIVGRLVPAGSGSRFMRFPEVSRAYGSAARRHGGVQPGNMCVRSTIAITWGLTPSAGGRGGYVRHS